MKTILVCVDGTGMIRILVNDSSCDNNVAINYRLCRIKIWKRMIWLDFKKCGNSENTNTTVILGPHVSLCGWTVNVNFMWIQSDLVPTITSA